MKSAASQFSDRPEPKRRQDLDDIAVLERLRADQADWTRRGWTDHGLAIWPAQQCATDHTIRAPGSVRDPCSGGRRASAGGGSGDGRRQQPLGCQPRSSPRGRSPARRSRRSDSLRRPVAVGLEFHDASERGHPLEVLLAAKRGRHRG